MKEALVPQDDFKTEHSHTKVHNITVKNVPVFLYAVNYYVHFSD